MSKNQFEKESCEVSLERNNEDLYNKYKGNCTVLKPFWDASTPPGYTYHGEKHIKMVVQYVGRLLGSDRIGELTDDELFILLMGVLCHDVGMTEYKTFGGNYISDRENHNINSYLKVYDSSEHKAGSLGIKVPSNNPTYNELIALLCLGHRDHEENGKKICTLTEESTINGAKKRIPETDSLPDNSKVRVQYLASILRLADEIDVTNQRAPKDVEMHLKDFITDEAKTHWCTHQLIKEVRIAHNPTEHGEEKKGITEIYLIPDVKEIIARSKDKERPISKKQLLRLVFSRRKKIEEEISIINTITNRPYLSGSGLAVEYRVCIDFDNEVVTKSDFDEYQKDVDRQIEEENNSSPQKAMDDIDSGLEGRAKKKSPVELFNDEVIRLKRDNNLLETGSFSFSFEKGKKEYTQYFINTQRLLTNRSILDSITEIFKNYYCKKNIDCVIGIGKAGIILAPNLSLKLKCNCSYCIGDWEDASVKWEKNTSVIKTAKNVLVLLDVISTGTATKHCLKNIKKENKDLTNIYIGTVFCTNKTIKESIKEVENVKELFSINDDFQFRTYTQKEYDSDKKFKKEFELLPLRNK